MKLRYWTLALAATLSFSFIQADHTPAQAGKRSALVGFGVGVAVGIIANKAYNKRKRRKSAARKRSNRVKSRRASNPSPRVTPRAARGPTPAELEARAAERARVRDIQTRLNALNFNAGTPDGLAGRRTRSAISAFQASIGMNQTGSLTPQGMSMLIDMTSNPPVIQADVPPTGSGGLIDATPVSPIDTTDGALAEGRVPPSSLPAPDNTTRLSDQAVVPTITAGVREQQASAALSPLGGEGPAALVSPEMPDVEVLGVQLNDEAGGVLAALESNGLSQCSAHGDTVQCVSAQNRMMDSVVIKLAGTGEARKVRSIVRVLNFANPLPRADLLNGMQESYGSLLRAPGMRVVSSEGCGAAVRTTAGQAYSGPGHWIGETAGLQSLAGSCAHYMELGLPEGENVSSMSIVMFAGEGSSSAQEAVAKIRF